MSARRESEVGLRATVYAEPEAVLRSCERAAGKLGAWARVRAGSGDIAIEILPESGGLGNLRDIAASAPSPVVRISLYDTPCGATDVDVQIETYWTTKERVAHLPLHHKRMRGASRYLVLLDALEQELAAVGKGSGHMQRTA